MLSTPSTFSTRPLTTGDYIVGLDCLRRLGQRSGGARGGDTRVVAEVDDLSVRLDDVSEATDILALARRLYPTAETRGILGPESVGDLKDGIYRDVLLKTADLAGTVDVLRSGATGWEMVCVEGGTSVKGSYLDRAAFLSFLARDIGLDPARVTIVTLDKSYVREEELCAECLFRAHDVTAAVRRHLAEVAASLETILPVWREPQTILRDDEYRCRRPDTCDACGPILGCDRSSVHSIFTLRRGGEVSRRLFREGVKSLLDIPDGVQLSVAQRIQIEAVRTGKPHVDMETLRRFLSRLQFPLYFLDFEAVMYAVPRFRHTRPWQHLAFQYSLHTLCEPNGHIEHRSFIARPCSDARPAIVELLYRSIGDVGSIVVYGRTFEARVLRKLGGVFASYGEWAESAVARVVDLSEPFQSFVVYHPKQLGRVSLKHVLPALTGVGYGEQQIGDGRSAALVYQSLCRKAERGERVSDQIRSTVFRRLEEYCALDTFGMVLLYRALANIAG